MAGKAKRFMHTAHEAELEREIQSLRGGGMSTTGQAQDSLTDQMQRVLALAVQHGEYDAADWLHTNFPWTCRVYPPSIIRRM